MAKKKLTKKATRMLRSDVVLSVAVTSLLINVFFIAGLVLFNSTSSIDEEVYDVAFSNLCDKHYEQNMSERMENSDNPELAKLLFEAECKSGEFTQYYQNAVEAYVSDNL